MLRIAVWTLMVVGVGCGVAAAELSVSQDGDGVTVNIDGKLFTRYLTESGPRPVLWPVIGPTEQPMTRGYPVGEGPADEAHDHPHHRSVWIGYEGINGIDYWHETASGKKAFPFGEQRHRRFTNVDCDGATATIVAENDWVDHEGAKVCEDERTWTLGTDGDQRWLNCRMVLTASEDALEFADSKEGFFAVRVADSMNVDHKTGGRIVNSRGQTNAEAWAQPAEWVDYQGPIDGKQLGLAIFMHPETHNYPNPWHVRTYGLFAGNPLGKVAFTRNAGDVRRRPPSLKLPQGETLVLHYRIVLHQGDEKEAQIAEKYQAFIGE